MKNFPIVSLALLCLAGCTFNARWLDARIDAEEDPGAWSTLVFDGPSADLGDSRLVVRGADRETTSAYGRVVGLLGMNDDEAEVLASFGLGWSRLDDATVALEVRESPTRAGFYVEEIVVDAPAARDIAVETDAGSISILGIEGDVSAHATSGSIEVDATGDLELAATSGSIVAHGHAARAVATSGSIDLALEGGVEAAVGSGSIAGTIGGGGSLRSESGSITVELTRPLDRDLTLEAGSGSIHLIVPSGASMLLDLDAGSGSVTVETRGVSHHGDSFEGIVGRGGFLVHARAGSGSIEVTER